ncbi:MAG: ATP-binding protein [Verrucomicrobia bacterium]|nr:ATP-binding protein [Cytophagales bacterium]
MRTKTEIGQPILKIIESIFEKLKDSQISEQTQSQILSKLRPELNKISKFLNCTSEETLFFSVIFGLKVVLNSVYYNDMITHLNCNPFFLVGNESIIKSLQKKRLISKDDNYGRGSANLNITREAYNAVVSNKPMGSMQTGFENMYVLLQNIDNLVLERRREAISTHELFEEIQFMLNAETALPLLRNLQKQHLNIREVTLLLYVCYHFANGDEYVDLNESLNMIFDMMGEKITMKKELINKEADLVKKDLIEFESDFFLMGRSIKLTNHAIEILFEDEADVFEKKKIFRATHARLIENKDLRQKPLFYNEEEKKQLDTLTKLLQEDKLQQVLVQFELANMPKGIVVLLYGEPGTGKTESVYAISKCTGRHILLVDIANIKDKYVGESEKHIKQVFDNYRKAKDYFDKLPILVFNESDALISKRIEITSSVDQMNNAMQNILLQELENFEGILFATSNLNVNLDNAFERRFLYKIQFKKPDQHIRTQIWQSKLPDLQTKDAEILAKNFDFTGGQIDNVARKYLLECILNETKPALTDIEKLCQEERFGEKNWEKMGF